MFPWNKSTNIPDQSNMDFGGFPPQVFSGLSDSELSRVLSSAIGREYSDEETIVEEGQSYRSFYVVKSGDVSISRNEDGEEKVLATLSAGDVFGEIAFIKNMKRTATVKAVDNCSIIEIGVETFEALSPNIKTIIYKNLIIIADERLNDLWQETHEQKRVGAALSKRLADQNDAFDDMIDSELVQEAMNAISPIPEWGKAIVESLMNDFPNTNVIASQLDSSNEIRTVVLAGINNKNIILSSAPSFETVREGVNVLGADLVLLVTIREMLSKSMINKNMPGGILDSAVDLALVAWEVSSLLLPDRAGAVALTALFHNAGEILIERMKAENRKIARLLDVLDRDKVGEALIRKWGLPAKLAFLARLRDYPRFNPPHTLPEGLAGELSVLSLSDYCYSLIIDGAHSWPTSLYFESYCKRFAGSRKEFEELYKNKIADSLNERKGIPVGLKEGLEAGN